MARTCEVVLSLPGFGLFLGELAVYEEFACADGVEPHITVKLFKDGSPDSGGFPGGKLVIPLHRLSEFLHKQKG